MIYHKPYPQIIEKGQIRNSIDGLTHRSLADSCEIEYINRNGNILMDSEKLKLLYYNKTDNEGKYHISNVVFNKSDFPDNDIRQLIPNNSKFRVRLISKDNTNQPVINAKLRLGESFEYSFILKKEKNNLYMSDYIIIASSIDKDEVIYENGRMYLPLENKKYELIDISYIQGISPYSFYIETEKNLKQALNNKTAYCVFSMYYNVVYNKVTGKYEYVNDIEDFEPFKNIFNSVIDKISDLGFQPEPDYSLTPTKFDKFRNSKKNIGIFYYNGHGGITEYPEDSIPGYLKTQKRNNKVKLPVIDMFLTEDKLDYEQKISKNPVSIGKWNSSSVDLIYFDCCEVGKELEWFKKYFNAECAVGYKRTVLYDDITSISEGFFKEFDKPDEEKGEYKKISDVIWEFYKEKYDEEYNPTDLSSDCPIRIINDKFTYADFFRE
ncbi:MAG: hypothetical protein M0R46_16860 [Candidatus Muirbacterium halophilum]|nr:hypothetical protein [Candidatus Muirbacterium halophilum]